MPLKLSTKNSMCAMVESHAQTFMSDLCQDSQGKYTILKGTILLKYAAILLKRLLEILKSQM